MTTLPEHLWSALLDLDDAIACRVVADWLEENGAPEAADVRLLASVVPVIPVVTPRWLPVVTTDVNGTWALPPDDDERATPMDVNPSRLPREGEAVGRHAQRYPMACGPWWSIDLCPDGIFGRVYHGTPVMDRLLADVRPPAPSRVRSLAARRQLGH